MIVDITSTVLTPGNFGKDCLGNGNHIGIACCCDECDYMMCCLEDHSEEKCLNCKDPYCPHSPNRSQ